MCVRIGLRVGVMGGGKGGPVYIGSTTTHEAFVSGPYFWRALVSIGSLALAAKKPGGWKVACGWLNTLVDKNRLVD